MLRFSAPCFQMQIVTMILIWAPLVGNEKFSHKKGKLFSAHVDFAGCLHFQNCTKRTKIFIFRKNPVFLGKTNGKKRFKNLGGQFTSLFLEIEIHM